MQPLNLNFILQVYMTSRTKRRQKVKMSISKINHSRDRKERLSGSPAPASRFGSTSQPPHQDGAVRGRCGAGTRPVLSQRRGREVRREAQGGASSRRLRARLYFSESTSLPLDRRVSPGRAQPT
ncbi:hypothetical protein H8959_021226 [Pygathrix nigripes]